VIGLGYLRLVAEDGLRVVRDGENGEVWLLSGPAAAARFGLINEFLGYLTDRNYSPRTRRSYAFDLMAFARWLDGEGTDLAEVDVDVLLRFLTACREAVLPGRPGGNVYSIRDGRNTGYAPATINRRLAAISALFAFRQMRDPAARRNIRNDRDISATQSGSRCGGCRS
jgi:site-specific recombinase XerD